MSETVITSIITSGIIALLSGLITYIIQERKLQAEKSKIREQFDLEREKLEEQYKTERSADAALSKFLRHVKFRRRSFSFIKSKMGGFEDEELRRMLIRNGAIRSYEKKANKNIEWWELLEQSKVEPEE
ncbi:hypothetical protein [Ekhidna sp. To15]|uniref:hypothetical protein n=1 Tax=Ekhidna sp. To15 TaxID=3395267 RepID=UPI003F5233CE